MRYSHNSHDSKSARANTEALEELTEIDNPLYSCRPPDGTNKWNDVAWNGQIETTLPKGRMTDFLCIPFAEFRQTEIVTIASSIKLSTTCSVTAPAVGCLLVENVPNASGTFVDVRRDVKHILRSTKR